MHGSKVLQQQLNYQNLLPYIKPAKKLDLPPDYCVKEELFTVSKENASNMSVYVCYGVWTCHLWVKGLLVNKTRTKECHYIVLFLFSCFQRSVDWQNSSFLPVVSSPVNIIKQCTTLKNIQGIPKQLSKTHIEVICNEYVYHITREATMGNATVFENII